MMLLVIKKERVKNVQNDKGLNDLEWIIEKLKKENYRLEMEVEMLKKDIAFLYEELQARKIEDAKSNN
jgi:predicted RNase H-like nuclease (RuvC/YqgF family)